MGDRIARRLRESRGATVVEYALVVALLVVPTIGAISRLDDASGDYYENASDDIGDLPQSGIDTSPGPSAPSASSTTTTIAPTTTTAAPTTTTAAPTTTTTAAPTTTTTRPPTTTTTLLRSRISELQDISTNDGSSYNAIARVRIVRNSDSSTVNGASVTIRMVDDNGTVSTKSCTTTSNGRCQVTWNRPDSRAPVLATVTAVTASPTWDNAQQSVSLAKR